MNERSRKNTYIPAVYAFATQFTEKLRKVGSQDKSIQRWARKINQDLFQKDYIFFPIHVQKKEKGHWVLAVRTKLELKHIFKYLYKYLFIFI